MIKRGTELYKIFLCHFNLMNPYDLLRVYETFSMDEVQLYGFP